MPEAIKISTNEKRRPAGFSVGVRVCLAERPRHRNALRNHPTFQSSGRRAQSDPHIMAERDGNGPSGGRSSPRAFFDTTTKAKEPKT